MEIEHCKQGEKFKERSQSPAVRIIYALTPSLLVSAITHQQLCCEEYYKNMRLNMESTPEQQRSVQNGKLRLNPNLTDFKRINKKWDFKRVIQLISCCRLTES